MFRLQVIRAAAVEPGVEAFHYVGDHCVIGRGGQVSWRKTVEEDVLGPLRMWPLSCYAHTASPPGAVKNDVEAGEKSMEEVHWEDLQGLRAGQSGPALQQAFERAAASQKQLFQVCLKAPHGSPACPQ